jgi:luciferase family oxidoreductase group 1
MVTLSVLDQVPFFRDKTATETIKESIALAQAVERFGYQRFWIAEHHGGALTCASPEILVAAVAASTTRIRVGSGGVMLPHYSPLKVAETFRLLHALFPDRIDLGVGRGPGASPEICKVLRPDSAPVGNGKYTQQVCDLIGFLENTFPEGHPYQGIRAMPEGPGSPEVWLLGAGPQGGVEIAASLGLSFCFAQFIHNRTHQQVLETYRQRFCPSPFLSEPRASLAVRVLCADTEEEARRLALSFWLVCLATQGGDKARLLSEETPRVPTAEEAAAYNYTEQDDAFMQENQLMMLTGTPVQLRERLEELAALYGVDELVITTSCSDLRARIRSYQLLAQAFKC